MVRACPSSGSVGLAWSLKLPFLRHLQISLRLLLQLCRALENRSSAVCYSLWTLTHKCIIRALPRGAMRISFLPFGIPTIIIVVCVYCRCLRGYVHPCVCTSGSQSKILPLCLKVLRQDLLLNKKLTSSARLADQIALGIHLTSG